MSNVEGRGAVQSQFAKQSGMLSKYRSIMVGNGGILALLLCEIINLLFMPLKSRLGESARKLFLNSQLGKVGRFISIGANCTIRNGKRIFIGDSVIIGNDVTLDVKPGMNKLVLGDNSRIGKGTIINCAGGEINIGKRTIIESFCRLGSLKGLKIGHDCTIGINSCIVGAGHSSRELDKPIIAQPITCNGTSFIGDFVTIGERVTVFDGIRIGSHVKIAADSLVNRDIPSNCNGSGTPVIITKKQYVLEK